LVASSGVFACSISADGVKISRSDRADHREHLIALDQLTCRTDCSVRIRFIIFVNDLHRPAENATAGVDFLSRKIESQLRLTAIQLHTTRER
jgi:hypothetical protein